MMRWPSFVCYLLYAIFTIKYINSIAEREMRRARWEQALQRCMSWTEQDEKATKELDGGNLQTYFLHVLG